jgi:hypothetical protein
MEYWNAGAMRDAGSNALGLSHCSIIPVFQALLSRNTQRKGYRNAF